MATRIAEMSMQPDSSSSTPRTTWSTRPPDR